MGEDLIPHSSAVLASGPLKTHLSEACDNLSSLADRRADLASATAMSRGQEFGRMPPSSWGALSSKCWPVGGEAVVAD